MAEPFKNLLNETVVVELARGLAAAEPRFPRKRFVALSLAGLEELELKARARHIADALEKTLPSEAPKAFELLVRSLPPPLPDTGGSGFRYFPYSEYLGRRGPEDVESALAANHALTQRFTSEFCIRPLLIAAPERTIRELSRWVTDPSPHVRRLVSEGTRPRLPWGSRLPAFQRDPAPVLSLLERLRDDPSEYVRRSVANNLNDIAKDHPEMVLDVAERWLKGASRERRRLVEHALRTLVKKGDPRALALLGAGGDELHVKAKIGPKTVHVGESVRVSALVSNAGDENAHVVVDVRIHFVKPRGPSAKVFKLGRRDLAPGERYEFARSYPMLHRTIRQLHEGRHEVEVQVNGRIVRAGAFELRERSADRSHLARS